MGTARTQLMGRHRESGLDVLEELLEMEDLGEVDCGA